jgi:hypothetical protein
MAQEKPAGQHLVANEIIVKFSGHSRGGELAARALTEQNSSDAALAEYVRSISSELHVPLEIKRFGSGGNVILAVPTTDLLENLTTKLRGLSSVADAHVVSDRNGVISSIELDFKESSRESEILARGANKNAVSNTGIEAITEKLGRDLAVPLTARVTSPRRLVVAPDLERLILDLTTKLKSRADVEYAQPNFVRRLAKENSGVQ